MFLIIHRPVQRSGQTYVRVEAELEFNRTAPVSQIPSPSAIEEAVREAVTENSTASNLTILPGSILVTGTEFAALERSSAL